MMIRYVLGLALALVIAAPAPVAAQNAASEKRIALVIGNAAYQAGALSTPANDAGLVAQTLQAAGFDVVGARDLDQDSLRRAFRDFLDKAQGAGSDAVAFVYLAGYGLQLEGENYFVPVDARIARDSDVAAEAVRLSDYIRPLAALHLKASIVVVDAARASPFAQSGPPLAGGLALVEPEFGSLIAFNAAPGTVAPEREGPYGPYAHALAEMMRDGGLPLAEVFERVRLRVNDVTRGAQVPWHAARIEAPFVFFERGPEAPPPPVAAAEAAAVRTRAIRDVDAHEAYMLALERDTLQDYLEFVRVYPDDPMAARVRAIIAARREAITWRRTRLTDTPPAYWSYLSRYPHGPHSADAQRRLAFMAAELEPPPSFPAIDYDVEPPPPDEIVYVQRPVLVFDDPVFAFAPPPPPAVVFLPPPPPDFVVLPPPPPPVAVFLLPTPVYRPVPLWVRPPTYVVRPPNNVIFTNVHNTVVINNRNAITITTPAGQTRTMVPAPAPAARARPGVPPAPVAALAPALPPSVAQKALVRPGQPVPTAPGRLPGQPLPGARLPATAVAPPGAAAAPPAPAAPRLEPGRRVPAPAATAPSPAGTRVVPPATATRTPPPRSATPTPPAAAIRTAPPPAARTVPSTAARTPPTAPPPQARTPPPPAAVRAPPPVVTRAPPAQAAPPPAAVRAPPPPAAAVRAPPPAAAAARPPAPGPKPPACPAGTHMVNGRCVR